MRKIILTIPILFQGMLLLGQGQVEFGTLSPFERDFKTYEKDSTAHAVYLYEKGENYFEVRNHYVRLITTYHAKIKILDPRGFSQAEIRIPFYHADNKSEKVSKIRGLTHNGTVKYSVLHENLFEVDTQEHWSEKRFTFPQVEVGSILEYTYEIESPYMFNLTGWSFQEDIPKVQSEYNAKIPGNYRYNRTLIGQLKLDVDQATLEKNCFHLPESTAKAADCEVLKYSMKDVPAFQYDDQYMLSPSNYRSRLEFELSEYLAFNGETHKYTKTWKDVDREFKGDKDIGGQLRKKNYFEKNVPTELFGKNGDKLAKAREIYNFVKGHYTWNQKFGIFRDNRVKQAFDAKTGNVAEINITLINLLNAADIETELMLMSTRARGLPKKAHPVMSDFNYVLARTEIDGVTYLLDATEKELPFGMLPYRCLNYYGRVMDLDTGSYWQDIHPEEKNGKVYRVRMDLDFEGHKVRGKLEERSIGYDALFKLEQIGSRSQDRYLDEIEGDTQDAFFIQEYEVDRQGSEGKQVVERFDFEIENLKADGTVHFNPFIIRFFKSNPFKAETRNHPVDFGYARTYTYAANINLPKGYRVKELPKELNLGLPDNSGQLRFSCSQVGEAVVLMLNFKLDHTQYTSAGYPYIKEIFEQLVSLQGKNYIVFERE